MEPHEGEEAEDLRLVGHEARDQRGEPLGVAGQLAALGDLPGRREVALVEDQVEDAEHLAQPCRQLGGIGHAIGDPRVADLPLGADEALRDRRLGHEEGARHGRGLEPADRPQGERDLRLAAQRRVAAREQQRKAIIGLHRSAGLDAGVERGGLAGQLLHPLAVAGLAPEPVDGLATRGGHQPGAGVARDAVDGPVLERAHGRVLHELLGEVPVAEDAHERPGQAPALVAQDLGQARIDGGAVGRHRTDCARGRDPALASQCGGDLPSPAAAVDGRRRRRAPDRLHPVGLDVLRDRRDDRDDAAAPRGRRPIRRPPG